jgi:hypothetical protein
LGGDELNVIFKGSENLVPPLRVLLTLLKPVEPKGGIGAEKNEQQFRRPMTETRSERFSIGVHKFKV